MLAQMFAEARAKCDAEQQDGRPGESATQRLDRNWSELLQEVRVTQTGVQLLTGFLLTLPFQQRFATLGDAQQAIFLADVALAVLATTLLVAPVLMHRLLFREHPRRAMVRWAHHCAIAGAAMFGLALIGVATLIFDIVGGRAAAATAGPMVALLVISLWVVAPWRVHRHAHGPGRCACGRGMRGSARPGTTDELSGVDMPRGAWGAKRERQYEHIKEGLQDRGNPRAEEIAARAVNKERARAGESRTASRSSTHDMSCAKRGGRRSHSGSGGPTKQQLYNEAKHKGVPGRSRMSKAELRKAVGR